MTDLGWRFHHLGLATADGDAAARWLEGLGYTLGPVVSDPIQRVCLRWAEHVSAPAVELVSPGQAGPGPIAGVLKRSGPGVYHTCWQVADVRQAVQEARIAGVAMTPLGRPAPAVLFGGREVLFAMIAGVGLTELVAG